MNILHLVMEQNQQLMIVEEKVQGNDIILQKSPEQKVQVALPTLKASTKFEIQLPQQPSKRRNTKPTHRVLANLEAIVNRRRTTLENRLRDLEKSKQKKQTINKSYKNIKPRYNVRPRQATKTCLPSLSTYSSIMEDLEPSNVLNNFRVISHVGKGCFSVVSAAVNKNDHHKYAIKTYTRIDQMEQHKLKSIHEEVKNLFKLQHQNIISLKHAVKDGRKIQLIMENGGKQSLAGLLRKVKNFDEDTTKKYFKQMIKAVSYCHEQNICHRDIKLENMLVDDSGHLKIIDFGFSTVCGDKSKLITHCGTPPYMSPELAARQPYNGLAADIWALGVALFLMLIGKFPFRANDERELYRLIQQNKPKYSAQLSVSARSLLDKILKTDPSNRASAQDILANDWLNS